MSYVGKIIKNTLLFAAVGALVMLAAGPVISPVAQYLGLSKLGAIAFSELSSVGLGAAIGAAFGAIASTIEPIFNIFSGKSKGNGNGNVVSHSVSHSQSPDLPQYASLSQDQELAAAPTVSIGNDGTVRNQIKIPAALVEKMVAQEQAQRNV